MHSVGLLQENKSIKMHVLSSFKIVFCLSVCSEVISVDRLKDIFPYNTESGNDVWIVPAIDTNNGLSIFMVMFIIFIVMFTIFIVMFTIFIVMFMYSYCYMCFVLHILFSSCQLAFFGYPDRGFFLLSPQL
jgi:hypothetical protein